MLKPDILAQLGQQIAQRVTQGDSQTASELQKNIQALLKSAFAKLDLVTREEFDIQTEILARTRAKVDALEQQVQQLEQLLQRQEAAQKPEQGEPPAP